MKRLLLKWDSIIEDYEANVTHIFKRRIIHRIFDVVTHSILQFNFNGKLIERGWVDALIAGDTRTGKSEVSRKLSMHYGIPRPIIGESLSFAGLVGGVQSIGDKWSINWGAWPRLDRRMAVMDETTSMSVEMLGNLSDIRSSGKAVITKIQSDATWARVRKLWLSNIRQEKNTQLSQYLFGCLVIPDIMGRPEDIARLDFATTLAVEEVPESLLNRKDVPKCKHTYIAKAAHELVFWCWTRKPEDVVFEKSATEAILNLASRQCRQYTAKIPLVEQGEQRYRVARVACALAARFHSTDKSGEQVKVTNEHVELTDWFFKQCYDRAFCGYDKYSLKGVMMRLDEVSFQETINVLSKYPNAEILVEAIAFSEDFKRLDVIENNKLPQLLAELLKSKLLEQGPEGLRKTKRFIEFYRRLGGKDIEYKSPY